MTDRLFVYGTLMSGSQHPMALKLASSADHEGAARYNGRLYQVTHYPGVVASDAPDEWVFGDVFALRDPNLLLALDRYEGCGPDAADPPEYRRLMQTVTLESGSQVQASIQAWVYVYNWPVDNLTRIVSGRFNVA